MFLVSSCHGFHDEEHYLQVFILKDIYDPVTISGLLNSEVT
jgi:hypothetical protein